MDCRHRDSSFKCTIAGLFSFIWLFSTESLQWEYMFIKVPDCEMASGFYPVNVQVRDQPACVTLEGGVPFLAKYVPSAEDVLGGGVQYDIKC